MLCIIKIRDDYPDDYVEWDGEEYHSNAWYTLNTNPYRIPKSIFDVQIRKVHEGDRCPDCKQGVLEKAFQDEDFADMMFIWCDVCGAMDEDDWWEDVKLKISWRGSGEVRRAIST